MVTFTTTSVDTYTDARFSSTFSVTLKILQLEGQQYSIILGMGKVDARFSPTTSALPLAQITAVHFGDSNVDTFFLIELFI